MKGIRFYRESFTHAFGCILPDLAAYSVYGVDFRVPSVLAPTEEDADRCVAELKGLCYEDDVEFESGLFRPGFFPKYADGISNDWNKVFVLRPKEWTREELEEALEVADVQSLSYLEYHRRARLLVEKIGPIALFQNWDAGYWQLFTPRKDFINRVISDAEKRGLRWTMVEFETNYPDPSDVALKMALADHEKRANQ
jgi:hypothetical protein